MPHKTVVPPRMITARDEDENDVSIDVAQLCAQDANLHDLMTTALERFFASGAVTDFPVGMSITVFDRVGQSGTAITTDWNKDIDLEHYSPDEDAIIDRRNAA